MFKYILDAYSYCDDYYTTFNILCISFMMMSLLTTILAFSAWETNFFVLRFIFITALIGLLPVFLYWKSFNAQQRRSK